MKDVTKGFCFNLLCSLTMVSCRKKDFTTGLKALVIGLLRMSQDGEEIVVIDSIKKLEKLSGVKVTSSWYCTR